MTATAGIIEIGDAEYLTASGSLRRGGQVVALSPSQAVFFDCMLRHRGALVTTEQLMGAIYARREEPACEKVLHVFACHIRAAFRRLGTAVRLDAVRERGFVLVAPPTVPSRVELIAALREAAAALEAAALPAARAAREVCERATGMVS